MHHFFQLLLLNTPAQRRSRYDRELQRLHRQIVEHAVVIAQFEAQKRLLESQALELEKLALTSLAGL